MFGILSSVHARLLKLNRRHGRRAARRAVRFAERVGRPAPIDLRRATMEAIEPRTLLSAGLTGSYFPNMALTGTPVTRVDTKLDFFMKGSPAVGVPADRFSARWTGQIQAANTEAYTFTTSSDDGVRLWVDGKLLINNWTTHVVTDNKATINLIAGKKYDIKVEYFENWGYGTLKLKWSSAHTPLQVVPSTALFSTTSVPGTSTDSPSPVPPPVVAVPSVPTTPIVTPPTSTTGTPYQGLLATFYNTTTFSGSSVTRVEPNIAHDWGTSSPHSGIINSDYWSARWVGQIAIPKTDTYTFSIVSDEGARLYIDGKLVINDWTPHIKKWTEAKIALTAGKHDIKLEYYDNTGSAVTQLRWSSSTIATQFVPPSVLSCVVPPNAVIPGIPTTLAPFTGYKIFSNTQVNFHPQSLTQKLVLDGYKVANVPVNTIGINVAGANPTTHYTINDLTIRNTEVSGVYRTGGAHNDFIRITGWANQQSAPMNVTLENITIHDGHGVPILIADGDFDTILIRNVNIYNTTLNQIQIGTVNTGHVRRIIIENSPGVGVAFMGRPGSVEQVIVRNSPGARTGDANTHTGAIITYLP